MFGDITEMLREHIQLASNLGDYGTKSSSATSSKTSRNTATTSSTTWKTTRSSPRTRSNNQYRRPWAGSRSLFVFDC